MYRHVCLDLRDRYACAREIRALGVAKGFKARVAAELALCAAELASNAVRHGSRGVLELLSVVTPKPGLEIRCTDSGPGFTHPTEALDDGWSRGRALGPEDAWSLGLGSGLGTIRRLMDHLEVQSAPGCTVVIARRYLE